MLYDIFQKTEDQDVLNPCSFPGVTGSSVINVTLVHVIILEIYQEIGCHNIDSMLLLLAVR